MKEKAPFVRLPCVATTTFPLLRVAQFAMRFPHWAMPLIVPTTFSVAATFTSDPFPFGSRNQHADVVQEVLGVVVFPGTGSPVTNLITSPVLPAYQRMPFVAR